MSDYNCPFWGADYPAMITRDPAMIMRADEREFNDNLRELNGYLRELYQQGKAAEVIVKLREQERKK